MPMPREHILVLSQVRHSSEALAKSHRAALDAERQSLERERIRLRTQLVAARTEHKTALQQNRRLVDLAHWLAARTHPEERRRAA